MLLFLTVFRVEVFSQDEDKDEKKLMRDASIYFEDGDYGQALPLYLDLYAKYPEDPLFNFCLGVSYLSLAPNVTAAISKERAIPHLEFADKSLNMVDINYFLGRAYHLTYRWDQAIEQYQSYIDSLALNEPYYLTPLLQKKEEFARIERYIEMCQNGKVLMKDTADIEFENMGPQVNSGYPDYAPAISADNEALIFTSRRPDPNGNSKMAEDYLHYENVYITYKVDGEWVEAIPISENINTKKHNASIGLSADAQTLFVYAKGDIYISELDGQQWSKPKKLGKAINTSSWETHITMTSAQNTIYFVSDRKGGFGGRDIYRAHLGKDGEWGDVENLGPTINTPYDEEAPFIHPDERHLYFGSDGHNSMGGFDIFYAKLNDGVWGKPVNMGHPINTPGDDIYFTVSSNGKSGYLSTIRDGGYGEKDVFIANMPDTGEVPLTVIRGLIRGTDNEPIGAEFIVTDKKTKEVVGRYKSNSVSGKYLLVFPPGREYDVVIVAEQYVPHAQHIEIPAQDRFYDLFQEIQLTPAVVEKSDGADSTVGQQIVVRNAFFDIDSVMAVADLGLESIEQKELAYSFFLGELEQSSDEEKEILAAKVASIEGVGEQLVSYEAIEEVHIASVASTENLEMHILGYDTVYTTSATTTTIADDESLALAGIEVEEVYFSTREEVEEATYKPEEYFATKGLADVLEEILKEEIVEEVVEEKDTEEIAEEVVEEKDTEEIAEEVVEEKDAKEIAEEVASGNSDNENGKTVTMQELDEELSDVVVKPDESGTGSETIKTSSSGSLIDKKYVLSNVYFDFNSSILNNSSREALNQLWATLNKASDLVVEISGHTCNMGEAVHNQILSTARASSVVNYLVKKGIPGKRLTAKGYGAAEPLASNDTKVGRKTNRRTELKIVDVYGKVVLPENLTGPATGKGDISKELAVGEATVCTGVTDREPIGAGVSFSIDRERLYYFSRVTAGEGVKGKVSHVWYYQGKKMAEISLDFTGPRWRTFSSKRIVSTWTGKWKVEVVSESGVVLKSTAFTIE